MLFTSDLRTFERLLGTMAGVLESPGTGKVTLKGAFEGRRNWQQERHDEDMQVDEDIEGLRATVGLTTPGRLDLSLAAPANAGIGTVTRIQGDMTGPNLAALKSAAAALSAWAAGAREELDERMSETASPRP